MLTSLAVLFRSFASFFSVSLVIIVSLSISPGAALAMDTDDYGDTGDAAITLPVPDDASFAGSANYRYPIEVPPGRNGMAPKIELTYNNQRKSTWMGVGWDLDMGYIQRSTKWGLDYASGDDFIASFNGATVELVHQPDWSSTTKYCYGAKIEGAFTKYCRLLTGTLSWEATAKDGTKYYYGQTVGSRLDSASGTDVFKWCLDTVVDTNGNTMTPDVNSRHQYISHAALCRA